jgi:hypothetical protein
MEKAFDWLVFGLAVVALVAGLRGAAWLVWSGWGLLSGL